MNAGFVVICALALLGAAVAESGEGASLKASCHSIDVRRIQPTVASMACVDRYAAKLTAPLNEHQRLALGSFAADVGCAAFRSAVVAAGGKLKHLPHQMLRHTSGHTSQRRRNIEVSLFLQPTTCVTAEQIRSQRFNPSSLPPSTPHKVWAVAEDTGRVEWRKDVTRRGSSGRLRPIAQRKGQLPTNSKAFDSSDDDDDSTGDDIGAPCPSIDGFVIASRKRCCPADQPTLIGLLCYERCPEGFTENGFGCRAKGQAGYERMPKLPKYRPAPTTGSGAAN